MRLCDLIVPWFNELELYKPEYVNHNHLCDPTDCSVAVWLDFVPNRINHRIHPIWILPDRAFVPFSGRMIHASDHLIFEKLEVDLRAYRNRLISDPHL